jgi:hypothetical protein
MVFYYSMKIILLKMHTQFLPMRLMNKLAQYNLLGPLFPCEHTKDLVHTSLT